MRRTKIVVVVGFTVLFLAISIHDLLKFQFSYCDESFHGVKGGYPYVAALEERITLLIKECH